MTYDAVILGGGAAGLMAACALSSAGLSVCLLEKQPRVGRKLLSTGNGRCNLTNEHAPLSRYHGEPAFAREAMRRYPPEKIREVFRRLGLPTRADEEGRIYPMSNQAASVLDALRLFADEHGCETRTGDAATGISRDSKAITVSTSDGTVRAKNVLVCTGGPAAPKLGGCTDGIRMLEALGHKSVPCAPALTALKTPPERVRALKGQRVQGRFTLLVSGKPSGSESGEIIFGDTGISGIAAMQLSRAAGEALRAKKAVVLSVEILPMDEARVLLAEKTAAAPKRALEELLSGIVAKRVGMTLLKDIGIAPLSRETASLTRGEFSGICAALADWHFPVTGVQGFDAAQVTAGGLRAADFCPDTMESRLVPGVYAAGEVLNIDGDCGGFNLQWAWASALTAAEDIIRKNGGNRNDRISL